MHDLEASGSQSRLGDGVRQVLTELRRRRRRRSCSSPTARPPRASRSPRRRSWLRGRGCRSSRSAWECRAGPRHRADRAPGRRRRLRRRRRAVSGQAAGEGVRRREAGRAAQGASRRLEGPESRPRTCNRSRSSAPADGQPRRVELIHHPKETGERTFILEVDPRRASFRPTTTGSSAWSTCARRS